MEPPVNLSAMPMPMRWDVPPSWCRSDDASTLKMSAGAETDLFVDPGGDAVNLNAPRLLGTPPEGDFQFSARVHVDFEDSFDAGVLLVWADESRWAKLCFERSPAGEHMVVSVVTRGSSDDANGFTVPGSTVWLRIARLGRAFAFHASPDGTAWSFVRYFDLGAEATQIGFEAQAPTGKRCDVGFTEIRYRPERLADLRDGT